MRQTDLEPQSDFKLKSNEASHNDSSPTALLFLSHRKISKDIIADTVAESKLVSPAKRLLGPGSQLYIIHCLMNTSIVPPPTNNSTNNGSQLSSSPSRSISRLEGSTFPEPAWSSNDGCESITFGIRCALVNRSLLPLLRSNFRVP